MLKGDHRVCPALVVPCDFRSACAFVRMFPLAFRVAPATYASCSRDPLLALNIVVIVDVALNCCYYYCYSYYYYYYDSWYIPGGSQVQINMCCWTEFLTRLSLMCRASRSWGTHPDVLQSLGGPHNSAKWRCQSPPGGHPCQLACTTFIPLLRNRICCHDCMQLMAWLARISSCIYVCMWLSCCIVLVIATGPDAIYAVFGYCFVVTDKPDCWQQQLTVREQKSTQQLSG